jgi:hypothetical protein
MRADAWTSTAELAWREPLRVRETSAEYVFLRPRLYLETTISSYLTARMSRDIRTARLQRITSRWWNSWRTNFDIYISDYVSREAALGDSVAAGERMRLLESIKMREVRDDSQVLRERILHECALPSRASTDAAHVAVAAVHEMEYLLTWNCAHLANPNFAPKISAVCKSAGYRCPVLCTPEQLLERYEHGQGDE